MNNTLLQLSLKAAAVMMFAAMPASVPAMRRHVPAPKSSNMLPVDTVTQQAVVSSDGWAAEDALGRKVRSYRDAPRKRKDKYVAMFYWTWHQGRGDTTKTVRNISRILRRYPDADPDSLQTHSEGRALLPRRPPRTGRKQNPAEEIYPLTGRVFCLRHYAAAGRSRIALPGRVLPVSYLTIQGLTGGTALENHRVPWRFSRSNGERMGFRFSRICLRSRRGNHLIPWRCSRSNGEIMGFRESACGVAAETIASQGVA